MPRYILIDLTELILRQYAGMYLMHTTVTKVGHASNQYMHS